MMDTTRRYPRTLTEAFGPYATGPIYPKASKKRPKLVMEDAVYYGLLLGAVLSAIAFFAALLICNR